MHGLSLSYFTGKLQAYFQVKGIAYRFVEMDTADFRRCAAATGIAQMPQVEAPDGTWLTDTSTIISRFESEIDEPRLQPSQPVDRFFSLLLEDLFDEWLWRPALYYRWAFTADAHLMSGQIAEILLRDISLPFPLRRRLILWRQKRRYLGGDGVTPATTESIEALYHRLLAILEPILRSRPFLFGERPCEADFGLFGPVFRHFSYDPTPAAILRGKAPHLLAWAACLWALRPNDLSESALLDRTPRDLQPLIDMAANDYLPYLAANATAYRSGEAYTRYRQHCVDWSVPTAPYRVHCLRALQTAYGGLTANQKIVAGARLSPAAIGILKSRQKFAGPGSLREKNCALVDRLGNAQRRFGI
ncbi:glutathione S-transferase family protein [Parasphingopyxis algicola]|uniref:glutathione S-transferase family protein n=1 Tax=Parasphingopyxis algicola TaxID=2026624 RepID=UPI001FE71217|nr:glutathione S-transferase family protein [Parasphingopyxis algicola]